MAARSGWIEVIVGSMFSGKTEELIRLIRRAELAKKPLQVFKPHLDDRYSRKHVASHSARKIESIVIEQASDVRKFLLPETQVVGIDEGQFFSEELVTIANELADQGKRVIIAGLDTDWQGQPFGPMPALMATAEVVKKLHAICVVCGGLANRTQRKVRNDNNVLIGSNDLYEARCRACFDPYLNETQVRTQASVPDPFYTSMLVEHNL